MEARDAFRNLVAGFDPKMAGLGMLGLCEFQTRNTNERRLASARSLARAGNNREIESVVRYHTALLYIRSSIFRKIAYDILSEFLLAGNESPKSWRRSAWQCSGCRPRK